MSLDIEPCQYLKTRNNYCQHTLEKKIEKSIDPNNKLRRRENKIKNKRSRRNKESTEQHTYKSNITLSLDLQNKSTAQSTGTVDNSRAIQMFPNSNLNLPEKLQTNVTPAFVFFDLETSGLTYQCDILQVAFKCGTQSYKSYVTPTKVINGKASEINW